MYLLSYFYHTLYNGPHLFPVNFYFYFLCLLKPIASTGQFASAPNAVRLIVAKEGFRGLYVGFCHICWCVWTYKVYCICFTVIFLKIIIIIINKKHKYMTKHYVMVNEIFAIIYSNYFIETYTIQAWHLFLIKHKRYICKWYEIYLIL